MGARRWWMAGAVVLAAAATWLVPARAELSAAEWRDLEKDWKARFQPLPLAQIFGDTKKERAECKKTAEAKKAIDERAKARQARADFRADLRKHRDGRGACIAKHFAADDPRALEHMAKGLALVNATLKALEKVRAEYEEAEAAFVPFINGAGQQQYQYGSTKDGAQEWHIWIRDEHPVVKAVIGDEMVVKRLLLDGFANAKGGASLAWLLTALDKNSSAEVRCGVAQALATTEKPEVVPALATALGKDKDGLVRVACLDGLIQRKAADYQALVLTALADPVWEVRAAAVDAIVTFEYKDAKTIDALIEALVKEEGRLRKDLEDVLHARTQMRFAADGLLWRQWWKDNRAKFESGTLVNADEKRSGGEIGSGFEAPKPVEPGGAKMAFYGIETMSRRIVFVFDRSGSMKEKGGSPHNPGGPVVTGGGHGGGGGGEGPTGDQKIDVAKFELKKAVNGLASDVKFSVIFYSDGVTVWKDALQPATAGNKRDAIQFIEDLPAEGSTNIFDAVERAFGIGLGGAGGANGGGVQITGGEKGGEGPDTIFLLSDGSPCAGRIQKPNEILAEIQKMNRLRRIVIHSIGIGKDENRAFMKALADQNEGTYVHHD